MYFTNYLEKLVVSKNTTVLPTLGVHDLSLRDYESSWQPTTLPITKLS